MIQFCIMGGQEAVIQPETKIYFTLMGGCDLRRETLARRLLAQRQRKKEGRSIPRQFFITIMGATEVTCPTLADEFIDLQQLLRSGQLTLDDWDRAIGELSQLDVSIGSFTLMGGFSECEIPSESQEIESLALQRHMGNITREASDVLQHGIGKRNGERHATLRRALLAEA